MHARRSAVHAPLLASALTIGAMHAYLQYPDAGHEAPRFLRLALHPDLFGGWELLRETGRVGRRSQLRRDLYLQADEAHAAFAKARDGELHRGAVLVSSSD